MWITRRRAPRPGDELRYHRDRLIDDYLAAGVSRDEAERRARFALGDVAPIEEAVKDVRGRWLEDLARDLRYAARTLGRARAFAAVAVLSLALGIGANAAIFTLINAVLLTTLPVREPDRLVQIGRVDDSGRATAVSFAIVSAFGAPPSTTGTFAHAASEPAIVVDGREELVNAEVVSGGYAAVLGLRPAAGRLLGPDDDRDDAAPAATISDRYWDRRFGRDPAAVGRTFTLNGRVFTIVGVTPPAWRGLRAGRTVDVMIPLQLVMTPIQRSEPSNNWLTLIARIAPGATRDRVNAEVQVLWRRFLEREAPAVPERHREAFLQRQVTVRSAPDGVNPFRIEHTRSLLILMGIVGLVLLLACVNLSGLLLARAAARQREMSIRLAIGAGRGRLMRQLLTESLLLAALGGALGLGLARWLGGGLLALFAGGRPLDLPTTPDWRVLAFTSGVSLLACILAGLLPAWQAVRGTGAPALRTAPAAGQGRLGSALVALQIGISMVLVVGATLFVSTLVRLYAVDRGIDADGLLVVTLRSSERFTDARGHAAQSAVVEQLRGLPGVRSVSAAQMLPLDGNLWTRDVLVEGEARRPGESRSVGFNAIAPGYFATLGTRRLAGRDFTDRDDAAAPKVAMVNERFARAFFGASSALGRRVTSVDVTYEIVGVVADARGQHLRVEVIPTMYIPWRQRAGDPPTRYRFVARVAGDPQRLAPELERVVPRADPGLRVREWFVYERLVERSIAPERVLAALGGFFGLLALVIAGLGLFGVLAFQVSRRTSELGVRMALGASRAAMMALVFRQLAVIVGAGLIVGTGLALTLTGLTRAFLFGTTPTDPRIFAIAAALLAAVAVAAGWLPARRAARVDPLVALRHD